MAFCWRWWVHTIYMYLFWGGLLVFIMIILKLYTSKGMEWSGGWLLHLWHMTILSPIYWWSPCIPIGMKNVQTNQATLTKKNCLPFPDLPFGLLFHDPQYEKWVGRHFIFSIKRHIFLVNACFKNLFENPFWWVGRATVNQHMGDQTYCERVTKKCTISI